MSRRALLVELLTLAAFCGFLLFYGLGAFGLVGADEPRYAQIAREMLSRHDWVVPTLNGVPWLEKPILYYWEAMLSYRLFGVSDWAARVPSAVSATMMVFAIFLVVRTKTFTTKDAREHPGNTVAATDAALIALSSAAVIGFARGASTDMPLAANFTVAMLCWYVGDSAARRIPAAANGDGASGLSTPWRPWFFGFYFFLALATLAKGPVAPGLAGTIILVTAVLQRDARSIRRTLWWPGILLYFAVAAPWFCLVQARTGTFFRVFFLEHNLERFGTNLYRHSQPFWYYLPVLLLSLLPWTIWGIGGFVAAVKRRAEPGAGGRPAGSHIFLAMWAIVPVIFFSFSQSKLPGYILPAVPAWTLLAAWWIEERRDDMRRAQAGARVLVVLHAAICAVLVAAVILSPSRILRLPVAKPAIAIAAFAAVAIFAGMVVSVWRHGLRTLRFVTLVPVVIAVAFVLRIAAPAIDAANSARPVAQQLQSMESRPAPLAVLHVKRDLEYGLNFYRDQAIASYDRAQIPAADHLVVARAGSEAEIADLAGNRRVVRIGEFAPQHLEFFWVTAPPHAMAH